MLFRVTAGSLAAEHIYVEAENLPAAVDTFSGPEILQIEAISTASVQRREIPRELTGGPVGFFQSRQPTTST